MAEITEINRACNLVMTLSEGKQLFAEPLDIELFRRFYRPLALVWGQLSNEGLIGPAGEAIAWYLLRDNVSKLISAQEAEAIEAEIRSSVWLLVPSSSGFSRILLHQALGNGKITEEEKDEVMNSLVYFIAASAIERGERRSEILKLMSHGNLGLTSQGFTDWSASQAILPKAENGKAATS
ncbi:putative phage protein [Lasius niger]|uniref:Putative phage protein n=1 Tax=Lasius niger TaxID=67767 RepID=A0A0J7KH98_LASNI|nr:putative phage protein [Lasius niger]